MAGTVATIPTDTGELLQTFSAHDIPLATVLEVFGEYFVRYCLSHGYDEMLRTLGDDFESFIQNLDSLHSLLTMTYKEIVAPSFRCNKNDDGTLTLHYYSKRKGLYPIVLGTLTAVGKEIFNTATHTEVLSIADEEMEDGATQAHVTFKVTLTDISETALVEVGSRHLEKVVTNPIFPPNAIVSPGAFCQLFPYHIIFDKTLTIKQAGVHIQRFARMSVSGEVLSNTVSLIHPQIPLTFHHLKMFINANYIMALKVEQETPIMLRGQMIWLEEVKHMIFIGSPRFSSLNELMTSKLYLCDIPLYDCTRELVLLNHQRMAEIEISKKLDETTAELKRTAIELAIEKKKTDVLLYQMLPKKVADQLRIGKTVEAEKFDEVTILFSDIVTFTNIAAAVTPIDIVNMLNELYTKFDQKTTEHNVYKVETIGDAYMVVGGVPDVSEEHSNFVANFSLDMVEKSREVKSPLTKKPLQIRVGIHTGSVVAGVVGNKMPRYCLFGDTVNTASRMESHGMPGRIHVSPFSYAALKDKGYIFKERGEQEIKGKGKMYTYFLTGGPTKSLEYEADEFKDLEDKKPSDDVASKDKKRSEVCSII